MSLDISRVTPANADEWGNVLSWVYHHRSAQADQYPLDAGEKRFLARLDGKAAGGCTVIDLNIARGASDLKCGGVAGVATLPEYRGAGVADALMKSILAGMREDGFSIAALYPYRSKFYRKFGYENCGWRWQIKCPQERFPKIEGTLPVSQIQPDRLTELDQVYVPFIRERSGSPTRREADWKHRMGQSTPMVYAIGDPIEAYLWVNLETFWGDANVGEVAWTTRRGYESAIAHMRSLCANQTSMTWHEPPDSPFIARYFDQGVTATLNRQTMYRVIDVKSALQSLRPSNSGSFCFELIDSDGPWNQGVWGVRYTTDGVEVTSGGTAQVRLDVRPFSQALMGEPDIMELARMGLIEVLDPAGLAAMAQLLDPRPVVCMEFF